MKKLVWQIENTDKTDSDVLTCVPITEYADLVSRSITSVRHLVLDGNRFRKMMAVKVHGHLYIPEIEITGYPHVDPGVINERIYHDFIVDENLADGQPIFERQLCQQCSYTTKHCEDRAKAEALFARFGEELSNSRPKKEDTE